MKRLLLFFAMLISLTLPFEGLGGSFLRAQGNDPVLAGMILAYTNKAEKELGFSLTKRSTGGRSGGGSTLTPEGIYRSSVDKGRSTRSD